MAIRKISEFVEASSPQNSDKLLIERNGSGKSITVGNLLNDVVNSGIGLDLLWTNANPSGAFPSQDIKVDTAPYKAILIEVAEDTTSLDFNTVVLLPRKGVRFPSLVMDTPSVWKRRDFTDRGTQIAAGISYKCSINGGLVENSSVLIPLNIWGIK